MERTALPVGAFGSLPFGKARPTPSSPRVYAAKCLGGGEIGSVNWIWSVVYRNGSELVSSRKGHMERLGLSLSHLKRWGLHWLPDQLVTRCGGGAVGKEDFSRKDAK